MDELVNQVAQRAGISQTQAQQAVQAVVDFLKQRVPGPVAAQLDNFVSGQGGGMNMGNIGGQAQQGLNDLGGMTGGNRP